VQNILKNIEGTNNALDKEENEDEFAERELEEEEDDLPPAQA